MGPRESVLMTRTQGKQWDGSLFFKNPQLIFFFDDLSFSCPFDPPDRILRWGWEAGYFHKACVFEELFSRPTLISILASQVPRGPPIGISRIAEAFLLIFYAKERKKKPFIYLKS